MAQFQTRGNRAGSGSSASEQEIDPRRSGPGGSSGGADDILDRLEAIVGGEEGEEGDDGSFSDEFFWQDAVFDAIQSDLKRISKEFDMDLGYIDGWFEGQKDNLATHLESEIGPAGRGAFDPNTPFGIQNLIRRARTWVGVKWPPFMEAMDLINSGATSRGSGRRGSGRRGPTAAEIRASFDMDQLTNSVNQMSRALILSELPNASAVAKSYVDAIVSNPAQELDFETFARERIMNTARAKTIYRGKPESMSEEQFLQPYVQAAAQRIGPGFGDQLADTAINAARLGASPQAFQQRLERTRQVQTSAPFLNRMGEHLRGVKEVLR